MAVHRDCGSGRRCHPRRGWQPSPGPSSNHAALDRTRRGGQPMTVRSPSVGESGDEGLPRDVVRRCEPLSWANAPEARRTSLSRCGKAGRSDQARPHVRAYSRATGGAVRTECARDRVVDRCQPARRGRARGARDLTSHGRRLRRHERCRSGTGLGEALTPLTPLPAPTGEEGSHRRARFGARVLGHLGGRTDGAGRQ